MYSIRRLSLKSVALYSFFMFLIVSAIFMVPFGLLFAIIQKTLPLPMAPMLPFKMLGGFVLVCVPLFYAAFGTLVNVCIAGIYNLLSRKLGGIRIEAEKIA